MHGVYLQVFGLSVSLTVENNDGIPDVQQISSEEFYKRKAALVFQNIDYHRVTESLNGLNAVST